MQAVRKSHQTSNGGKSMGRGAVCCQVLVLRTVNRERGDEWEGRGGETRSKTIKEGGRVAYLF